MIEEQKTNHFMVDIETLGTNPRAPIWQIAVVSFNIDESDHNKITLSDNKAFVCYPNLYEQLFASCDFEKEQTTIEWLAKEIISLQGQVIWEKEAIKAYQIVAGIASTEPEDLLHYHASHTDRARTKEELHYWLSEHAPVTNKSTVWSRGIDFDFPILKNYLCNLPWQYYAKRDVRTLVHCAGIDRRNLTVAEQKHNAADDCLAQIKDLENAMNRLRIKNLA